MDMKRKVKIIYLMVAILTALPCAAQEYVNTPVEISKERVKINGKLCYSHVVLERQTLFSISKAYEVSIEDIFKFNPTLEEEGLKKNSIIIIPSKDAITKVEKKVEPAPVQKDSVQTAKKTVVAKKVKPEIEDQERDKAKRIHIAKWYEDLDVIAEQYGVSVEAIMKANNLSGRKLKRRHKLVIPYPGEEIVEEIKQQPEGEESIKNEALASDTLATEEVLAEVYLPKDKVDATIILPLTTEDGSPNRNNMDFYSGALLAVYDLAQKGIDCNLNVFDIMDSETQFSTNILESSDVVIGPVSAADLQKLFNVDQDAAAVVSPLDPRAERLVREHSSLIHAPTPHLTQYQDLVKWMEEDYKEGDRVIMITEKGARQSGINAQMKEALDSSSLAYSPFSYSILEGRDVGEPLTALMTNEGTNRVLIASESEAFVNDVVRNLNLLIYNNLDINLYAPSRIRGFETIEVENMHNTSMHVSLGYYIDYEDAQVKDFLMKYRALYNTEPTQFAFQGYDLTRYFLELNARFGDKWKNKLEEAPAEMLQSKMHFKKEPSGGYVNRGVRRIQYETGYNVRKVR